ncbi:pyridoxamine 5'-phosphate oxidase family protein [Kitasatospora mediocidica]|uniref:pyridoxamine 5'-phosphate oxidase family protein n=1 Tax=Kitasatospora mediocidica TaxID=58352 RepID=UPI00068E5110|nr:pyridoxamine 5'-phosphate oxidase family protein [Kitasatospora mediocidica]
MEQSPQDLAVLQQLIDESARRASPAMRASFGLPEQSLTAAQLVRRCAGVFTAVLATTTAKGEPRCAPVGVLFHRGRLHVPTSADSNRARNLAARPALSLSLFDDAGFALIVHGSGVLVEPGHADFEALEDVQFAARGTRVSSWGRGVFIRIEADLLFSYARDPQGYPG